MSLVNITNIIVEDNPAPFLEPLKLKITFESVKEIQEGFLKSYNLFLPYISLRNRMAINIYRFSKR